MHYHFTTHEAMEADIAAGKFLEHAHVHKNIYGTSVQAVQDVAAAGRCCVLDIDVQGARQVGATKPTMTAGIAQPASAASLQANVRGSAAVAAQLAPLDARVQVRQAGLRAIFVFIAPPSLEELEHRLRGRATGRAGCCARLCSDLHFRSWLPAPLRACRRLP